MTLKDSLDHVPTELAFGTSGLRGLVSDMTDLECYINTAGFIDYLKQHDNLSDGSEILLAGDLRDSTPRIMKSVCQAILDAGYKVGNCGLVPTPTVALLAYEQQKPCIMVTGSHIPADRNGIKYYKREGEVLKADEAAIKACVTTKRQEIYDQEIEASAFAADGSLIKTTSLPPESSSAAEHYVQRFKNFFAADCLQGKKLVFYQQSAVGRDLLVELLRGFGAEVVPVEPSDKFIPIDTENVTAVEQAKFKSFAEQYPDAFAILSTDGDSDRPFVVDETGTFHRGDILGAVVATYLGADFAAMPISSNDAVDEVLAAKNIETLHTKIGSPYVVSAMASADSKTAVGWEVNGGFMVGSEISRAGRVLTPLPTRDAALPIICALLSAIDNNQKISELFAALPARFTGGGMIDNVDPSKITRFLEVCQDEKLTIKIMNQVFADSDLGKFKELDLTDGLRLRFASNDVLHLRPSGNAPQFRVYSNAGSQARANDLVELAISSNGYIPRLLSAL